MDSTLRFSKRADWYARYRPSYPPGILDILARELGFSKLDVVADIGSGTGLLARLFLANGNRVFGVEPNDRMRSYAERDLAGFGDFVSVKGTAERTTLPSGRVDLVAVGQALHWFNPGPAAREISRISKPRGCLCVVYNERINDRLGRAYRETVRKHERDRAKEIARTWNEKYLLPYFRSGKFSRFEIPNEQVLDFEGLLGRLVSASYMPSPEEKQSFAAMMKDVRGMFDSFSLEGKVRLRYRANIFIGRVA